VPDFVLSCTYKRKCIPFFDIEVYVIYSIQRRCYCTWMARRREGAFGVAVA
jgi:hypothetical protein